MPPANRQRRQLQQVDTAAIAWAAGARWLEILTTVAGIPAGALDGKHHPCPRCGGRDRFRLIDPKDGAVICNQCGRSNGDGIASIRWATGLSFRDACQKICDHLGIEVPMIGHQVLANGHQRAAKLADEQLVFQPWNEFLVWLWARHKPPITPAAVALIGGKLARYLGQFTVIALPVWGEKLMDAEPVGWVLYNTTGKGLPVFERGSSEPTNWVKIKTLAGSGRGWIGNVQYLPGATTVWKLEGPSDVLGLLSISDRPTDGVAVLSNVHGCGENPAGAPWMLESLRERNVNVCHDADRPGQEGAVGRDGKPGWAPAIATTAAECRHIQLPYPIVEDHGPDVRDWLNEGHGYQELTKLADGAPVVDAAGDVGLNLLEADDDPHRLARLNLKRYATIEKGRTLRYWRDEWYAYDGHRYWPITERELKAKLSASIKEQFNLDWKKRNDEYWEWKKSSDYNEAADKGPPVVKKVSPHVVSAVVQATASMTIVSSKVEDSSWLPTRERKSYLSLRNGILDIDKLIGGQPGYMIEHSPNWFSKITIPYEFDKTATCPKFEAFLEHNQEMDPERIKILQEWAGYLLLPSTDEAKFMILEGEGSNGKSVFTAAITAMLGDDNVSSVSLEVFGDRFSRTDTLGKLLNAAGDCAELDKVAEGYIKSFSSGDRMFFDRKGISGINCVPTARLMVSCNNRPRFRDQSRGIWRRMLLIPWRVEIDNRMKIKGMDKVKWWQQSGELPGILRWAIVGLARLRAQGGFTESEVMNQSLIDYQEDMNPAKAFLIENLETSTNGEITTLLLYKIYRSWIEQNGHGMPKSDRAFGREVKRLFRLSEKRLKNSGGDRYYVYSGIQFSRDEVAGEMVNELF